VQGSNHILCEEYFSILLEELKELRQTSIRIVSVPVKFRYGHFSPCFLIIQYLRLTALN